LGDPGYCVSLEVWLSVKPIVKRRAGYILASWWITAGELAVSRGARDLCEGKALREKPRNGCGTK